MQLTPNVDQPKVKITTRWFGASPEEISREVIEEQEEVLKNVQGLRQMRATATEGEAVVDLEFFVGVEKEAALNEVRDKLRQVPDYPLEVDEPVTEAVDSNATDFMAWMVLTPPAGVDPTQEPQGGYQVGPGGNLYRGEITELQDFVDDFIKPVLERSEGVAEINVFGGREREMQIRVDMARLASRGIAIDDFVAAIQRENQDITAGVINEGKRETSIRAVGQYEDPQEIRNTVVAYSQTGSPVYVSDVADVEMSFKRQVAFVRSGGRDVIAMNAKRETGANVLQAMEALRGNIERVNEQVLAPLNWNLRLKQVYDQTIYVEQSVKGVTWDLLLGGVLAAGVLFITLRSVGATLVVAVSIPVSIVGTFLGLALTGRNINVISLAGMSFAIGMGVDNTIVVLENIFRHREMGKDRIRAAIDGTQEVWGAIVAATLANVAVFLPVIFIEEEAGQLFQDISVAITIALFFYMFVSPTVIPMLATLFLRKMPAGLRENNTESETRLGAVTRPLARAGAAISDRFYRLIFWLTGGIIRRVVLVVVMVGFSLAAAVFLTPPANYLPTGNQNLIFATLMTPPGYSLDEYRSMGQRVESVLAPWWEAEPGSPELREMQAAWKKNVDEVVLPQLEAQIEEIRKTVEPGQFEAAAGQLLYQQWRLSGIKAPPAIEDFFFVAFNGQVFMGATSADPQNVAPLAMLFDDALQGIPGTMGFAIQIPIFQLGDFGAGAFDVEVTGSDYAQVRDAAEMVQGMMIPKFGYAFPNPINFNLGRPEVRVSPDRVRAAAADVSPAAVRLATEIGVDGAVIGDYRFSGRAVDLAIKSQTGSDTVSALADLPLATRNGTIVPLEAVADFIRTSAPTTINRVEEQPSVTLTVQALPQGETVESSTRIIEETILPAVRAQYPTVSVRTTGAADKLRDFQAAFRPGFILAAVITYLLLAALFESFIHPLVIIMSVPFAMVGGLAALLIAMFTVGASLDVLTMLGFVILIGTIVNNPILIVHQALNYMREMGMSSREAIAKSTQTRVRPIFMSVVVSVAGMTPLVLGTEAGSELYRGLGAVVIGGLLVSTVFTLFLTPTLMSLMIDIQGGVMWLIGRKVAPVAAPAGDAAGREDGIVADGPAAAAPAMPAAATPTESTGNQPPQGSPPPPKSGAAAERKPEPAGTMTNGHTE